LPVLLVDCPHKNEDNSYVYFKDLMRDVDFGLIHLPLKTHGSTLDFIFKNIKSNRVLLLDSDAEIISKDMISFLLQQSRISSFFGSGFNNEYRKDGHPDGKSNIADGLYCERMWLPCTILNVKYVREALDANISFNTKVLYSEKPLFQAIARRYYKFKRKYSPFLPKLFGFSFIYFNPEWIFFDTGALIFQYLKYEKQYEYNGITDVLHNDYVIHKFGFTRAVISGENEQDIENTDEFLMKRIVERYGIILKCQ
jgi:hypothetical protein